VQIDLPLTIRLLSGFIISKRRFPLLLNKRCGALVTSYKVLKAHPSDKCALVLNSSCFCFVALFASFAFCAAINCAASTA
jgi:hypothetical protein